ncbi:hypothetical protein L1N85_23875 [Paenibacillus alkaliterrae]|uniref:hypothetical protein n=1 Tax=Paenibacillus alkaliterrae TaxID=320909 RepID=UPI001F1A3210|nr:hypothetical protein [Paenibacillus alkaliterrae]MCF2941390.1 hypothetical protein [Paenibacillus alkaliterrae]
MNLTLNEIIANLRTLKWDEMTSYLRMEYIPSIINGVTNEVDLKEDDIHLINSCIELIEAAIANQDIIFLCDLLEYEFAVAVDRILAKEGGLHESGDL